MNRTWERLFETGRIFRAAFREQQECIRDVYRRLEPCLESPEGTPRDYIVRPGVVPDVFFSWKKNIFSTLFQSVYHLLEIPEPRRLLYGRLIHLFRIWVTSADNLLDHEDKIVVPLEMPGSSRVMRQVVALMAADRVLAELLEESAATGMITLNQVRQLSRASLQRLLPSAAQEATEEGGIRERPEPDHVLNVIHRLKTGLLFNIAFAGPEILEPDMDRTKALRLKEALMQFGLGCQVLDDIRDMARDLLEGRHNYVLSELAHHDPLLLESLRQQATTPADRLYLQASPTVLPAARRGFQLMRDGLQELGSAGLGYSRPEAESMANTMFVMLDLEELHHA